MKAALKLGEDRTEMVRQQQRHEKRIRPPARPQHGRKHDQGK
jgi:hypothetical protein